MWITGCSLTTDTNGYIIISWSLLALVLLFNYLLHLGFCLILDFCSLPFLDYHRLVNIGCLQVENSLGLGKQRAHQKTRGAHQACQFMVFLVQIKFSPGLSFQIPNSPIPSQICQGLGLPVPCSMTLDHKSLDSIINLTLQGTMLYYIYTYERGQKDIGRRYFTFHESYTRDSSMICWPKYYINLTKKEKLGVRMNNRTQSCLGPLQQDAQRWVEKKLKKTYFLCFWRI